jgi:hypothetical protein
MTTIAELTAMQTVHDALTDLPPGERERVLKWADQRLGRGALVDTLTDGLKLLGMGLDALAKSAAHHRVTGEQMRALADRLMVEAQAETNATVGAA